MINTDYKNNIVLFMMGPTASGKTDLAIALSKYYNTRLISVDSALIYKDMNIGSAKPDATTMKQHPHYLVDICTPEQNYCANNFIIDAKQQIEIAFKNKQLPILVGGTSFYFNALEFGLSDLPESSIASKAIFNEKLKQHGSAKLHQELALIDKKSAHRIHPNDSQRVMRALEVFHLSGKTLSTLQGHKKPAINYPIKKIILMPDRAELHRRIEQRFLTMLQNGFLDEMRQLRKKYKLNADMPAMRCVGYRQAWQYLEGEIDRETMVNTAIFATRQLCKRQSTWLKSQKDALILTTADIDVARNFIKK